MKVEDGTLKGYGEGRTIRKCPVCGSCKGRVGCAPPPDGKGAWLRGWLCFECGYFPGKDPESCLLNKKVRELEEAGKVKVG